MALLRTQQEKDMLNTFSSFQSVEKILEEITSMCLSNERLKKLLFYTDRHALALNTLTQEQSLSLLGSAIRLVPKLSIEPDTKPYCIFSLNSFSPQLGQTTFRRITLSIDILASYDHWILDDFKLRPYSIAGELDGMINKSYLQNGIAEFMGAKQLVLNDSIGGCSLYYSIETYLDDYERQTAPTLEDVNRVTTLSDLGK